MIQSAVILCDRRGCRNATKDPVAADWIFSSGETVQGQHVLHDHRATQGHYCSWNCFARQPVHDL